MKKKQLAFIISLAILGAVFPLLGALAKLEHWNYSNYLIIGGIILQLCTALLAIYFVLLNRKAGKSTT